MDNKLEPRFKDNMPLSEHDEYIDPTELKKVEEICKEMLKKTKEILSRRNKNDG